MYNNIITKNLQKSKFYTSKEVTFNAEETKILEDFNKQKFQGIKEASSIEDILNINLEQFKDDQHLYANVDRFQKEAEKLQQAILDNNPFAEIEKQVVEKLNKKYAAMTERSPFQILCENTSSEDIIFLTKRDFLDVHQNKIAYEAKNGKAVTEAEVWLKSPDRRECTKIVMDPSNTSPKEHYNLWQGFAEEPEEGSVEPFKAFVFDIICNGDDKSFDYLWSWLARLVQYPHLIGETAIVLVGKQGTGKNTFVEAIGSLFGKHFKPVASLDHLLGKFDFHLASSVFIHANEALWGGDKRAIGKLKTMVTEKEMTVEQKFKDPVIVRNCRHVIFSSNEDWPVHLDRDDRRFFVLPVSDKRKEDTEYFGRVKEFLDNGGREHLLYALQNHDISDFNVREIPQNNNAFEIKMESATSTEQYIFEVLNERRLCLNINPDYLEEDDKLSDTERVISKQKVYNYYVNWCSNQSIRPRNVRSLGRDLKKLIPSLNIEKRIEHENRQRGYGIPPVNKCRKEFEKAFKSDDSIWSDNDKAEKEERVKKDFENTLSKISPCINTSQLDFLGNKINFNSEAYHKVSKGE